MRFPTVFMLSNWWRTAALAAGAVVLTGTAHGYVCYKDQSDVYRINWPGSTITMHVKLPSTTTLTDGTTQATSLIASMQEWNSRMGVTQFAWQTDADTTYKKSNGTNEIVMDNSVDGEDFSTGALAVTVSYTRANAIVESDIVFNTAYRWDSYRGKLLGPEDIRRVGTHELGHVLGLDHPDENGQTVTALMNSHVSNIDGLQDDDIAGVQYLYGAPGAVPANDNFASATAIALGNETRTFTTANMAATRETGEPQHAGSTGTHSLWWRWKAPAAGTVTVSTYGSDFDTVLAAYTGNSLASLTAVAGNDDEESPAQNPTPQRKRTSKVTFRAVANTTYYLAVDGWGDSGEPGYSGAVTLSVTFASDAPLPAATTLVNIATRAYCSTGNGVTIGGFVVTGSAAKRVLIRAVGPSLTTRGIGENEVLRDPTVEVHHGDAIVGQNDDWGTNENAADIPIVARTVGATALASDDTRSSALLTTLDPGVYTFIVKGKNDTSGIVLLEVYDADAAAGDSKFVDIAARAYATTGNGVAIGGFVITGNAPKQVLMRAVGPTLTTRGIGQTEVLLDPTIELHHGNDPVVVNDDWVTNPNQADIVMTGARLGATPIADSDRKSSALLMTLNPGVYSFICKGKNDTSGIVLVEVYDAD